MTYELLLRARTAQQNILDLENILYSIKRIKINDNKTRLRFVNALKRKNDKEVREATVILFDGIDLHGIDIPVDADLLECIKEYYEKRLKEAKAAFEAM